MNTQSIYRKVRDKAELFINNLQDDEVAVMIVLARKKNNPEFKKSSRAVLREILTKQNWKVQISKGLAIMMNYYNEEENLSPHDMNLYLQVNPRSPKKALRNLKVQMADREYEKNYEFLHHMNGLWASCLEKKSARSRRQFYIIDIDTKDPTVVKNIELLLPTVPIQGLWGQMKTFETRNGYHIVATCFDIQKFWGTVPDDYRDKVEIKTDDCVFLWSGTWEE